MYILGFQLRNTNIQERRNGDLYDQPAVQRMKKEYIEAEVEVIEIKAEDIVTASCANPDPFAGSEGTEAVA